MAAPKFLRWDTALKKCMDTKGSRGKANRWRSDPLALNQEAHELSPQNQLEALDAVEEAPLEIRARLAPMWRYCFVQWHIYDAAQEAIEAKRPLDGAMSDELLVKDIDALRSVFESGGLEQAKTAEEWTWDLLQPLPPAGTIDPWNDATAAPVLQVGRSARRKGVEAFAQERPTETLCHCCEGLRLVAGAPPTIAGPHAKIRCDLYKNKAAAALKLELPRVALKAATSALAIDGADPKAWYRKSRALEMLGQPDEAMAARIRAGLRPAEEESVGEFAATDSKQGAEFGFDPTVEELEPRFHRTFEELKFIEVGIDSLAAVDLIMYLKSELQDVPVPMTLVFDAPIVKGAVELLLRKLQAEGDAVTKAKVNNAVWRGMCRALGTDPIKGVVEGRLGHATWPAYSAEDASLALRELRALYEEEAFGRRVRELAKQAAFEQRAFLVRLRPVALQAQRPFLAARGFDADAEGLRQLECAIVNAATESPLVHEQLQMVRMAQQGGPNGMWAVNMELDEMEPVWADCHSLQCWSQFMQADPFGPERKNTNAAVHVA